MSTPRLVVRQGKPAFLNIGLIQKRKILSYVLFELVRPVDKIGFVPITGNLVNGIAADRAPVQVIQHFEFFVKTQLLVEQSNQLFKTACIHSASQLFTVQAKCLKACV
jgi:hypothetical protein